MEHIKELYDWLFWLANELADKERDSRAKKDYISSQYFLGQERLADTILARLKKVLDK